MDMFTSCIYVFTYLFVSVHEFMSSQLWIKAIHSFMVSNKTERFLLISIYYPSLTSMYLSICCLLIVSVISVSVIFTAV